MKKSLKLFYNASKIWAILWLVVIVIGLPSTISSMHLSLYEFIFDVLIASTIMMSPLAIMRYIISVNKKQEKQNAIQ